jgi:hypothetical protein
LLKLFLPKLCPQMPFIFLFELSISFANVHFYLYLLHTVKCMGIAVTKLTGSTSDDWIYVHFGQNISQLQLIQRYRWFTQFTVHRCTRARRGGARGSVVGWGTMLQAGRSRIRVPMRWIFFNLPNPSSRTTWGGLSL